MMEHGISGRAHRRELYSLHTWNPRDFTNDVHHSVDDRPYGGGPGMVMLIEPLKAAIDAALLAQHMHHLGKPKVIHLSPAGQSLTHQKVLDLRQEQGLILLASRYEGVDQRLIDGYVDEELSIGDYVLSGGELPALVLMDTIVRQLSGSLGSEDSARQDSFATGLLDCPHYTRPPVYDGMEVPAVLLSGDHEKIRLWRLQQALSRTLARRPDLLKEKLLTTEEARLLEKASSNVPFTDR